MERTALKDLEFWGKKKEHLPLLVRGARQVGKTWLVREYGRRQFASFVELNLESHPEYHKAFNESFGKPQQLISTLSLLSGKKIIPEQTCLFIDEIQECPNALLSLRYFKENLPGLHVIAAGSLLEFTLKELSFPVGRIESIHLFPINFQEFLLATEGEELVNAISTLEAENPLPDSVHEKILDAVFHYFLVGGMPAVVKTWIESHDWSLAQEVQQALVSNFRSDFHKYASLATVEHIKKVFGSVPKLLGKKFKYSEVSQDIKSRELSKALHLLEEAGLVYLICHSSGNGVPLSAEETSSKFKVFFLDLGLVNRILGLPLSQLVLEGKTVFSHRGALAEQFVAQELLSLTPKNQTPCLHYWHRESKSALAEIDFLFEKGSEIIPVEVKSGNSGKAKSLGRFIAEKKPRNAVKISMAPQGQSHIAETIVHSLPLYNVRGITAV